MKHLLPVLLLGLLVVAPACKKRTGRKPVPTVDPVVFLPVPLAQRLPKDVEACVCTVNLNLHRQAMLKTNFWRLLAAFLDDKAPTAGLGANFLTQLVRGFDIDDIAFSAGQGAGAALTVLREISDLYDESRYRKLLRGALPGAQGAPLDMEMLDAMILNLDRFEMPPLMFAMRGAKAHERLKEISDWLTTFPSYAEAAASTITTTLGEQFGVTEVEGGMFLTKTMRRAWLEAMASGLPGIDEIAKGKIAHALEVIAGKPFVIALGRGQDTAFVCVARRKEQIRLAEGVEDSVVMREELQFAQEHASRDLLGFAFWQPAISSILHQPEPTRTLRQALLAMRPALAEHVQAAGAAERALLAREFRSGAASAWWEGGFQMEMRGGKAGKALEELQRPSRYHALADGEPVVFAMCGQGAADGMARAYLESCARLLEAVTLESELQKRIAPFKPAVMDAYDAMKAMWEKGLGADGAVILDTGGRMPPLPGLPPGAEQMALPRFMSVHEVTNRALLGEAWARLEKALGRAVSAIPGAQPFQLPPAESNRRKESVSHFYRLAFGSDDLMPCATVSDDRLLWGTSRAQQQELTMVKNSSAQPGTRLRLNFGRLREFLTAFAKARSAQNPGDAGLRETIRWLAPLGVLDWSARAVGGTAVTRFSLGMKDIPAYD